VRHHLISRWQAIPAALAAVTMLAACGTDKTSGGTAPVTSGAEAGSAVAAARAGLPALLAGTSVLPSSAPRTAAKGKRIAILSAGQNNPSAAGPVAAMVEACNVIGWQCSVLDGASNPASYSGLIKQAIAARYDGIIDQGIDCPPLSAAIQQARAAGIKVVGSEAFDCDDPSYKGTPQFSGMVQYLGTGIPMSTYFKNFGAALATTLLAKSGGNQKVLEVVDPEFRLLDYIREGFNAELAKDSTSSIAGSVQIYASDLGPKAQQKIGALLLQHPDATAITTPYFGAGVLGVYPAVAHSPAAARITVIGAEGGPAELDLVRQGKVAFLDITSQSWQGWAGVDTMNSVLNGTPVSPAGLGLTIVDKDHGLPATVGGKFVDVLNFRKAYTKAWGVD
jgi:ribose transport system substrate-binding protein